jgi:hypothetical protein
MKGEAMAKDFAERVEEVLGELHGMAWPLLEEPQKRKIVGKVTQGIDRYGDTYAAWARVLGCDERTVRRRVEHFRSSDAIDGTDRRNAETEDRQLRAAKMILRDERLVDRLLDDPKASRSLARAAAQHEAKVEAEVKRQTRERAPDLAERAAFNTLAGNLLRVRRLFAQTLDEAREERLHKAEREALHGEVEQVQAIADWWLSFLDSGASDFETELEKLLEG